MRFAEIQGRRLEYRLIPGDAEAPWLVFLHEGLGCVSLWRDFPDKVARCSRAPALIYSRQGYGRSDALEGARDPDFMHVEALQVLPELLATLGIARPVLIGHSDGASIALIHAAAHVATRGVALMAPHVLVEPTSRRSVADITRLYETTDLKARLGRHHAHVDEAFYGWARIWLDPRFQSWSLLAEAARLACPALLIQGIDDQYGSLVHVDRIEALTRGPVSKLVLDACGHVPWRDQEARVLDAISGFIGELPR